MKKSLLAIENVSKNYPGVLAVDRVTLDFSRGEIVGLVGKNGAGKSTIIRIIAAVEKPDTGKIIFDGILSNFMNAQQVRAKGLAFVHQELNDIPILTIAENIGLGLGYPKKLRLLTDRKRLCDQARVALAKLHMDIDPMRKIGTLSLAQRRMVMIARALVTRAKLIVLDEPTASLNGREIEELHAVARRLKDAGVCIIYVSHRLQEILDLTDRVVVMRNGRIVGQQSTKSLDEVRLISLIAGRNLRFESNDHETQDSPMLKGWPVLNVTNIDPLQSGSPFSLTLQRGEILGLAGLAGSGRTETVRQIIGADFSPNVEHRLDGKTVLIRGPADALKNGIAIVPENRRSEGIIFGFSVSKNITLSSLYSRRFTPRFPVPSRSAEETGAKALVDRLEIKTPSVREKIQNLSGGNQQKAILARCLAADVQVLILDEPTHGIDVDAKLEIYALIKELAESGTSIILISSELQELVHLSNRALILREGLLVGELEGNNLTEAEILRTCFGGVKANQIGGTSTDICASAG